LFSEAEVGYSCFMSVNERVKELRTALRMSQAEFAKAIFVSNGYIAEFETGKRRVNDRIIRLISLTFGASEAWLKDGAGGMFFATPAKKLQRLAALFSELPPRFQDYVMAQIEQLLAAIGEK